MNHTTTTRMLLTTAVLAAVAAFMAAPSQARFPDDDRGASVAQSASTVEGLDPAIQRAIEAHKAALAEARVVQNGDSVLTRIPAPQPNGTTGDAALTRVDTPTVSAQTGSGGSERDWTSIGLGAGFSAVLAAGMAVLYLSARRRDRVALP